MAASARLSTTEAETETLKSLRARFEGEGFAFTTHPRSAELPTFLGSYVPDAIARRGGLNVAIALKAGPSPRRTLAGIRKLFDGRRDWKLHVVIPGSDAQRPAAIAPADPFEIRKSLREMRDLLSGGHVRSAFVMSWSLLEAALRSAGDPKTFEPLTPGTVVQALAMNGLVDAETEGRLRGLIDVRKRIMHGDLRVEPSPSDVAIILSAIEDVLGAQPPKET